MNINCQLVIQLKLYKALIITLKILLYILICHCLCSQGPKMKDSATASTPKAKQATVLHSSKMCSPLDQQETSVGSTKRRYVLHICIYLTSKPIPIIYSIIAHFFKLILKLHGNIAFKLVTMTSHFSLFTCIYVW